MDSDRNGPTGSNDTRRLQPLNKEPALELGFQNTLALEDAKETANQPGRRPGDARHETTSLVSNGTASEVLGAARTVSRLQPGLDFDQYQLIRELGRGGMGAVYLARDTQLGRRVAVKFLANNSFAMAERFLTEARVTARCKHQNIVDIYDFGRTSNHSYMVLEYLQGVTLRNWLKERWHVANRSQGSPPGGSPHTGVSRPGVRATPVSSTEAVELIVPVVRALAHAHSHGLIHRDLKPENIMMTDDGAIKVLDFGIAKVLEHSLDTQPVEQLSTSEPPELWAQRLFQTREGAVVGTRPYMSPEQWRGADIDERTDLWAVGIILWELCTGHHPLEPFSERSALSVGDVEIPMPSLEQTHPQLGRLANIVDLCLRKSADERMASAQRLIDELERLLPGRRARARSHADESANPYVGLSSFQRDDADRFFGRDHEVSSLIARLRNHRIVTVAGASGSGKSSLIRAGLIPALERSGQFWEPFIIRPGRRPLSALATILSDAARTTNQGPEAEDLACPPTTHVDALRDRPGHLGAVLRTLCHQRQSRMLVFIDQFEELYTLCRDREIRETFIHCLEGVADDASSPLRIVLSVRSDFLDHMAEDRAFANDLIHGMTLLSPLNREQLHQALAEPLALAGYRFESDALVEAMLDSLGATRSPLPLLQFTAARLWEERDAEHKHISQQSYDDLGGIEGALATHADAVLAGLSRVEQRLARMVFTRLVSEERTRAIVSLDELRANVSPSSSSGDAGKSAEAVVRVVRHLAAARLILIETDSEGASSLELIHESLIERWPKLVGWLDEDEDAANFRSRLRVVARQWDRQGRSDDLLWRGEAALEAERWLERDSNVLDGLGARNLSYLEAVVALARRARRRRRQAAIAGFTIVLVVAVVVSWLAIDANRQARRADSKAKEAQASALHARNASRMASASQHQFDPTLVLALVREIEPTRELPPHWQELALWATHQDIAQVFLQHEDELYSAVFSPDGKLIVTASRDNAARVWKVDGTGEPLLLEAHSDSISSAMFSPDGTRIVTASFDGTARIWATDGTGEPLVLRGHEDRVSWAAFSPGGTRIVTTSFDGTARIWKADGTGEPLVLTGHEAELTSAAFSPDGRRVATASFDGTVRVWDVEDRGRFLALLDHEELVYSAAFSPDGSRIVTAAFDKAARIWNADGTGEPVVLRGHRDLVSSASFSPDGTRIITASYDKTAWIWAADGTGNPVVLRGHRDGVSWAAFSSDGTRVVTASRDRSARVWGTDTEGKPILLRGHQDLIYSASFSPDGTRIVTASFDKTARVWNADGSGEPLVLRGHDDGLSSAAFSPDGALIVTASRDKTARVWRADASEQPITVLRGHEDLVYSASFSPDGARIVTASLDKTARVWNADGTGQPVILRGHQDEVYSAAFSPTGTQVATASLDKTARIWNADGSGEPVILRGHQDLVYTIAYSPDGKHIVTASFDKTAKVWNADGSGEPVVLGGYGGAVAAGTHGGGRAFNPDGTRIVTISDDKTAQIWNADGSGEPVILRIPDADTYTAEFSPDGTRIVTASHKKLDPVTGEMEYWAKIWTSFELFSGVDDPALWRATGYCPSVALRVELLGVSEKLAATELEHCRDRVAAIRGTTSKPLSQ